MSGVGDLAARLVTPAPPRHVIGRAVADPATGAVTVDIGGGEIIAGVPSSVLGVAEGQMLRVSVEGRTATVDAILTGITPTAAPSDAATDADTSVPINTTTSSGNYDYVIGTNDWDAVRAYTRDNATVTRGLAGDINELRDDVDDLATAYEALAAKYNALAGKFNSLLDALQAVGVIT